MAEALGEQLARRGLCLLCVVFVCVLVILIWEARWMKGCVPPWVAAANANADLAEVLVAAVTFEGTRLIPKLRVSSGSSGPAVQEIYLS